MDADGMAMKLANAWQRVVATAAVALCALLPVAARAQTEAERKQAKEHYEKATRFYDVGKYGEAIAEYEQSYLLIGDAALLFNIGQAYRLWERPEDAIRAYKNYLRQRPDASNRADVERKIADLEKVVEERRHGGQQPPETVPPAAAPPYSPPTSYPMPPATGTAYPPAPGPPPAGAPVSPEGAVTTQPGPATPPPSAGGSWLVYTLFGVSGAGLLTAGIAGAVGASKAKKVEDAANNRQVFDPAVENNGKTANAIALVGGIVALAAGGTAGYLLWRQRKEARAHVSVAPALAPSYAGGAALLTF
jgi:tetratricopeptide (TPR) repeat protein